MTSCVWPLVSTCNCTGKVLASWKRCVWQGNQALVYFEWAKQGGPLRSMRREMPVGLTERPTSVPYRLLNNWMWYLTLWDCPGVAVAISDMKWRAADALFSTRLSSSSGNEKTTGMQGKEGRGSWQALGNQSHETHHTSAAPSKISNFIWLLLWSLCLNDSSFISMNTRMGSVSLHGLVSLVKTHLSHGIVQFGNFIFRHLVTMDGPGGKHSLCGTAADEFSFTLPHTYAPTVTYSCSV